MRLFLAIEVPAAWRDEAARTLDALTAALDALTAALDDATRPLLRAVSAQQLHLTARFLGEVDRTRLAPLETALAEAVPPVGVNLELGAPGSFGSAARTHVAWLGIGGDLAALRALGARIEQAVAAAALAPASADRGAPRPHLTLARVRPRASAAQRRSIAHAVAALTPPPPLPYRAAQLALIESRLSPGGPSYEVLARFSAPRGTRRTSG